MRRWKECVCVCVGGVLFSYGGSWRRRVVANVRAGAGVLIDRSSNKRASAESKKRRGKECVESGQGRDEVTKGIGQRNKRPYNWAISPPAQPIGQVGATATQARISYKEKTTTTPYLDREKREAKEWAKRNHFYFAWNRLCICFVVLIRFDCFRVCWYRLGVCDGGGVFSLWATSSSDVVISVCRARLSAGCREAKESRDKPERHRSSLERPEENGKERKQKGGHPLSPAKNPNKKKAME